MAGWLTSGAPNIPTLSGSEQIPCDTEYAQGASPQSGYVTPAQLAVGPAATTSTATSGAATLNGQKGIITSESLTTAAGSDYVLTLTNSFITAGSIVQATASNGTNTTEGLDINRIQPGAGSAVIHVRNNNATTAWNGTIKIAFTVE